MMHISFQELLLSIKHVMRTTPGHGVEAFKKWNSEEMELNNHLQDCTYKAHVAFCGEPYF